MNDLKSRATSWEAALLALLIVSWSVASLTVEGFAGTSNVSFLLLDVSEIALMAIPLTLVVITGEIDLSIASTLGLTSAIIGALWNAGLTIESIFVIALGVGAVCGLVNGLLVTRLGLPSLAVTIGTLALYRGLAYVTLGDKAVADFPAAYTGWATGSVGPIPKPILLTAVLALVAGVILHATPLGRAVFALGHNQEAAYFAGIRVKRIKLWLFVASGVFASLAGIVYTLRYSSARADNGTGLELAVVAAVLLGGVSFFGGRGTLPGVLTGVLVFGVLRNALILADVSNEVLNFVTGLLLISSVLAPNLAAFVRSRRSRTVSPPPLMEGTAS
ncbi:ABC transporter permease [Spirillospora sp. NPDC047279]|uniref:ABC transporter permease n=1 Tax=Spirillospora sp. NPDC047279 TaxID=3155478 RepID=UPI0033C1ACD9